MKRPLLTTLLATVLAFPVALGGSAVARADETGSKIIVALEAKAEAVKDTTYLASMAIVRGGATKKTLVFEMRMKGLDRQLIEFTAPGDVAGMKVLMAGRDELWMYSPEFKKVRRIAAHNVNQGFFGSHFTAEDMVLAKLSPDFDAALVGQAGDLTTLVLTPKPERTSSYSKLEVVVDRTKGGITELRYFDGAGVHVRTQKREDWKSVQGHPMPTKITMIDVKTGDKTIVTLEDIRVNSGLDDELFSRRTLLRG